MSAGTLPGGEIGGEMAAGEGRPSPSRRFRISPPPPYRWYWRLEAARQLRTNVRIWAIPSASRVPSDELPRLALERVEPPEPRRLERPARQRERARGGAAGLAAGGSSAANRAECRVPVRGRQIDHRSGRGDDVARRSPRSRRRCSREVDGRLPPARPRRAQAASPARRGAIGDHPRDEEADRAERIGPPDEAGCSPGPTTSCAAPDRS